MYKLTNKTRQGNPVVRVDKRIARRYFNEGKAVGVTERGRLLESDPDIFKADGDPMQWPVHHDFDTMANEQDYYAHSGLWFWAFDTASGLAE